MLFSKRNIANVPLELQYVLHLKQIAWRCIFSQFIAFIIFLVFSLFYSSSNLIAVCCGCLAISISLLPIFYAIYHKNFSLVYSCLSIYNLAPIWFLYLEAVLPGYDAYEFSPPKLRIEALMWVSVFQLVVNSYYIIFGRSVTLAGIKYLSFLKSIKFTQGFYTRLAYFAFFIPLVFFAFYYDSAEILWSALTAGRAAGGSSGGLLIQEQMGGATSFLLPISWLWQLTPLFGVIAFSSAHKHSINSILPLLLGFLVIFSFFLSGSRGVLMFVAAPVIFFFFYNNSNKGIKFWVISIIMFFFAIAVMEMQARFRGNLLQVLIDPVQASKNNYYESVTSIDVTKTHRDNNLYLLCLIIKGYPEKYSYEGFNDLFAIMLNPIPRATWPGKPVRNEVKELSNIYPFILDGPIFIGTPSLSYSVVGEAFKAFGFYGILTYSLVYGFFLTFFDGLIYYAQKRKPLSVSVLGLALFLAFWGFRSLNALVTFIYPFILILLIVWMFDKTNRKQTL